MFSESEILVRTRFDEMEYSALLFVCNSTLNANAASSVVVFIMYRLIPAEHGFMWLICREHDDILLSL